MLATIRGWPASHVPIDSLRDQVAAVGGEVIVMDGSGMPPPDRDAVGPDVTWISRPGWSVFQLRAEGYDHCRGGIVAVTEDHVEPDVDWCERILAAHAARPDAIAISGAVDNGTRVHVVDWASFIITQVHAVPPFSSDPTDRISGATGTYKGAILERRPANGDLGTIEWLDLTALCRPGDVLLNDDTIRVIHHQCMGIAATSAVEFHNGRTIAGFHRRSMSRGDWARIVGFPILPLYRAARTFRIAWGRRIPRKAVVASLPLQVMLHYAQASGEMVGYAAGAGSSPARLR
jgi:hypothetical protein